MERNVSIDIMKGIAIILVIIGHFGILPSPVKVFIFSFHMPLFFIVSGYFYKEKPIKSQLIKDFENLIVPYFVTCMAVIFFFFLVWLRSGDSGLLLYYLKASLLGSGSSHPEALFLSDVPNIGAIWFFPALFICKLVYNILPNNLRLISSAIIFLVSTLIGRYLIFIPMSVLSGLSAILFYSIGDHLKSVSEIKPLYWPFGLLCWTTSLLLSHIYLVQPRLDLYYVDIIGATSATLLVYFVSVKLVKIRFLASTFSWLGRSSLFILCFHQIEVKCGLADHFNITRLIPINYTLKLILPILATYVFVFLKKLLKVIPSTSK